ncbi:MAG: hypothetical protein U5P41_09300 [Gammaproteobacteria bacterium]|nr:hypothetical protein [Gammaproteobacteria bacterium]
MMWLPFPVSYRHRTRSLNHRLHEYLGKAGFHPIDYLAGPDLADFLGRDLNIKPYAEDFLQSPGLSHIEIWSTMGGKYRCCQDEGLAEVTIYVSKHQGDYFITLPDYEEDYQSIMINSSDTGFVGDQSGMDSADRMIALRKL